MSEYISQSLFETLDRRTRPEDVAHLIGNLLKLERGEQLILDRASQHAGGFSSMSDDFARPSTLASQFEVAGELFATPAPADPSDMLLAETYLRQAGSEIGKAFGANDFKQDRLSRIQRSAISLDLSRRQYNKRFRLAARMEAKRERILREQSKRSLALASKSRLASRLTIGQLQDPNTLAFVAYFVARCNLRSTFTNESQVRPYDEIADMLMSRCCSSPTTNWYAVAHVFPNPDILQQLDAESKGLLLGGYFTLLKCAADLLGEVWAHSNINRETMVVRRGNDSTTWNLTAGAWNKLRFGWFGLLFSMGLESWIDAMCPGKVLRLMAADVAAWHRASGGDLHADTGPWCDLPLPWEVLSGAPCPKAQVESVCAKWGVDPIKGGWTAPPPAGNLEKFTPTPELVHGVEVGNAGLAALLRKMGAFSGKGLRSSMLG